MNFFSKTRRGSSAETAADEWQKNGFSSGYGRHILNSPKFIEDAEAEVNLVIKHTALNQNSKILDLACGVGRHSIAFGKRGFEVVGIDINADLIQIAKDLAQNLKCHFYVEDLKKCELIPSDLILLMFNSFGCFSNEEDDQLILNNISKALRADGTFVLHCSDSEAFGKKPLGVRSYQLEGFKVKEERSFDHHREMNVVKRKYRSNLMGPSFTTFHKARFYGSKSLQEKLLKAGFKIEKIYGDRWGKE